MIYAHMQYGNSNTPRQPEVFREQTLAALLEVRIAKNRLEDLQEAQDDSSYPSIDFPTKQPVEPSKGLGGEIDAPAHYNSGSIECIDAIESALTPEEFKGYLKGNILKYTWREKTKGQASSMAKAKWYISRWLETK